MPPWPRMRPTRMCPKFWPARLMAEETNLIGSVDRVLLRYSSGRTIEYRGGTDESVPPRVPAGRSSRRPPPHIHVKTQGRYTKLLTTQLYFPNEPLNAQDWFYRDDLLVKLERATPSAFLAPFDFVLSRSAISYKGDRACHD